MLVNHNHNNSSDNDDTGQNLETNNHDPTTLPTHLPTTHPRYESS